MAQSTQVAASGKKRSVNVSLGQLSFGDANTDLAIFGLGSCIGVAIWSPSKMLGVMCHIIQPSSKGAKPNPSTPAKFADHAVPKAIETLLAKGAVKEELVAKLAGGAHPLAAALGANAGTQNAELIAGVLEEQGIKVMATNVGGSVGRTIVFHTDSGIMDIKLANGTQEQI